jgi:predicted DNA binding protein
MAIVAEILLADETLPLVGVADSIPSGELSISNAAGLEGGRLLLTVSVDSDSRDAFERELDARSQITDAAEIGQTADGWFYKLVVTAPDLIASHDPEEFEGVAMDATVTGDGIREQKVFSDYDAFSALQDRCAVNDIPLELLNIASDPENPGERDQFGLTDRQYRAMSVALSSGYYDSPRRCSTAELADRLDVSAAAASDLLRRAEKQLISSTVGPDQFRNALAQ